MMDKDLHSIPRIRDRLSYLYVEHAKIDQNGQAIAIHDALGETPVPCAGLAMLMLGPGITITHAAILSLAACGCLVAWVGEHGVRFYAAGTGTTRSAVNLMKQAKYWADPVLHLRVVRAMYQLRFQDELSPDLTLNQIRGKEGARVRDTYFQLSQKYGVPMQGRNYQRDNWNKADPINRALSVANSCLYGISHAAIVAAGFSPGLGFVHTGKQLSFVYDIADLYKMEMAAPAAFRATAEGIGELDRRVRLACRDEFHRQNLLKRIVADISSLFGDIMPEDSPDDCFAEEPALPGGLWSPDGEVSPGGISYGQDDLPKED
ncbi:MAG TPA: type I-E CRISPR-associated endonuclease Cas1e [Candidatus Cloacimonadota bacterium]|nr:type I-E CRISPR-associated endonuclease Cas1e [Candidatus Cloacimonadota bacterium]HQH50738.1 type I-E CRISPR-associated endonuclease Cas1e [Candidatus Cloacimonadota bacterium]